MHGDQTTYQTIPNAHNIKNHEENNLTMILPRSWQDLSKIFQVLGNLARFTNVGLPSSIPTLVVLTHEVPHPPK